MITSKQLETIAERLDAMARHVENEAASVGAAQRTADTELRIAQNVWKGPRADEILEPAAEYATEFAAFPSAAESAAGTIRRWAATASAHATEMSWSESEIARLMDDGAFVDDEHASELWAAQTRLTEADGNWRLACVQYCAELIPAVSELDQLDTRRVFPDVALPAWLPPQALGVPFPTDPADIAQWWGSLTWQEQAAMLDAFPALLGNLDGIPASIRDVANRTTLAAEWQRLAAKGELVAFSSDDLHRLQNIKKVAEILAGRERHLDPITGEPVTVQLYAFDADAFDGDGLLAISIGDLDTAQHTAVSVPGLGTSIADAGGGGLENLYDEARWATMQQLNDPTSRTDDPYTESVAVLEWVGYDAPSAPRDFDRLDVSQYLDIASVTGMDAAREGAARLASDVEGLRAMRSTPTHLTVWGNSYGSTTTAIAASEFDLQADDVVLTASPGAGTAATVDDFSTGREHTWVGTASTDAVGTLGTDPGSSLSIPGVEGQLGIDPTHEDFGATRFQAEQPDRGRFINFGDHSHYDNPNKEAAYNTAAIVAGDYHKVKTALPRSMASPGMIGPTDPEYQREPTELSHAPS